MKAWLIPLSCICIFSLSVQAQEAPPAAPPVPSLREACQADYHKLCAGVKSGGGRIIECLNAHKDDSTTACQEALLKAHPPAPKSDSGQAQPTKPQ
jgi:hypothetical protein